MKKLLELFVLAMVLTLVNPASAIERAAKFAMGGYGGYSFGKTDTGWEPWRYQEKLSFALGAKVKYGITPNFALVGVVDYQNVENKLTYEGEELHLPDSENPSWVGFLANGIYVFSPKARTSPYATAGFGYYMAANGPSNPGFNVGFGVEHFFQENVALDGGARLHKISQKSEGPEDGSINATYVQIYLGMTFYLGAKGAKGKLPPTKPPVRKEPYVPPIAEEPKEIAVEEKKPEKPKGRKVAADTTEKTVRDENPVVVIETDFGSIELELFWKKTPQTALNFLRLVRQGFYDGLTFHRIIPNFVIQGGCPLDNGTGGPGYSIDFEQADTKHLKGSLAMARSQDPNSAGSQFYICLKALPNLDGNYVVFGKVVKGMDVVDKIAQVQTDPMDRPLEKVVMKKVYEKIEYPKYPADLVISNIHFFEPSGNKVLDGFETAKLGFTIENQGRGEAVNVNVGIVPLSGGDNLSFDWETEVRTIKPSSSRSVEIPITAPYDITSEEVKFRVEISEEFGNDADPFVYSFETRAYKPPKLEVADVGIDDDREGDSQGDNDGIIEPGEAIEVTCAIQNTGFGDAEDVTAKMIIGDENVHYIGREQYNLGDIPSGDYKTLEFYFWIPKKYKEDNVPISVQLSEAKGRYGITKPLNLPVGKPSGYVREITVEKKQIEKTKIEDIQLSIDVEEVPHNSLTKLENGLCVIFGIEDYKYAPKATFANRDAVIFYEYAKSVFGIPERNIYIRTNEGATKGEFDKVFGEKGWLAKRVEKGKSDIIFYFSGHGAPDIDTKRPYLIPCDIDPNYAHTAFSLDKIYKDLSELGARSVTIFLDACFSGQSRGEMLLADARPLIPVEIEAPSADITVFTASTAEQISSVYSEKKHGLFSYYLLKGLQGYGDLNGDKKINVGELFNYLRDNVRKEAGFMDREQVPQLLSGDRERVLVKMR